MSKSVHPDMAPRGQFMRPVATLRDLIKTKIKSTPPEFLNGIRAIGAYGRRNRSYNIRRILHEHHLQWQL